VSIHAFVEWLGGTSFSLMLRDSLYAEPIVETLHVLTLTVLFGFAILLDLRLLGVSMRRRPASEVLDQLSPWLIASLIVLIVTGVLLFCGDPVAFYNSIFFKVKMWMLLAAVLNVLIFNATVGRKIKQWELDYNPPGRAKVAAVISLVLWVAIIATGRAIAYSLPSP
jgi:hypothetical protein